MKLTQFTLLLLYRLMICVQQCKRRMTDIVCSHNTTGCRIVGISTNPSCTSDVPLISAPSIIPAALFNLASAKVVSCQANETYLNLDLDIPISLFQGALDLRPTGHPDRAVTQLNLAIALMSRFATRRSQADADAVKELLSQVLDVSPANSHVYRAAVPVIVAFALRSAESIDANDLGQERPAGSTFPLSPNQLARRAEECFHRDDPYALDEVISLHYNALGYYSATHDQRGHLLGNLGLILSIRFERQGNSQDLDKAITFHREALALHPVGHQNRFKAANNLGNGLCIRIEHRGGVEDLDEAITLYREALSLRLVGHPDRSKSLNKLGNGLSLRFKHRGNFQDLDEAITLHREALSLHLAGHPDRSSPLIHLGNGLSTRFEHRGNTQDLDEAIVLFSEALALYPVGHPDRSMSLNNLGNGLSTRFEHRGNIQDLDASITLHREALSLRSVGHPDRSMLLNNLGNRLSTRFANRGDDEDLDEATALHRETLALFPVGHPDRSRSLNNLGKVLSTHFEHRGNVQDLDEAITLHREALGLRPATHPDRSMSLNNLAVALYTCFEHRGNDQDLDEAITLHREALSLLPVGHPDRPSSLNGFGNGLSTRFRHRGNIQDLDEAIMLHREALSLRPVGHPNRPTSLHNLGNGLSARFKQRGNAHDLDESITLHRESLTLCPVGHLRRSSSLDFLGNGIFTRFEHRGNDQDLDEAIALHREALSLPPVGHPDRSSPSNNLGNGLFTRFEYRGSDQDLNEAIMLHRETLSLHPVGDPYRCMSLNNLANVLSTRFKNQGNDQDLDEALTLYREALSLRSVGHPYRPMSLNNLAAALYTCFEHRHNGEDLTDALKNLRCALTLLTQHDPYQSAIHRSLATTYMLSHRSGLNDTGEGADILNAAMHHLKVAANVGSGGLLFRLRTSLLWVRHAEEYTHSTLLEAYATSMNLLDAYMSATASVSSRHDALKVFPNTLAVDAGSCALRSGDVCRAVELLEQGRTLIWTQMARLRTPLDSLQERGGHAEAVMKKFRDLSSLLDKSPANHSKETRTVDAEAEATRYTRLVEDWNKAVEEIRQLEGFSRFLLPPLFSELQDSARDGPIIVLVASKASCDAIIIPHKQPPVHVRLVINSERLVRLVNGLRQTVEKEAGPKGTQPGLTKALRELWVEVVLPVVDNLGKFAKPGSRIWWCPTSLFNFVPLHAAGEYRPGGKSLSQLYISSYTPSLAALISARRRREKLLPVPFAAIGQNHPEGASFTLVCVEPELVLVQSLLPPPPTVSFTKITSVDATKSRALSALRDNTWLHFACHGTQNFAEPFKSAFLMRDQPLSLLDITQLDLSSHAFAFLSACETAVGDFQTPDEVIHLAAALQFAGVESVVGTLWKVNDISVQRLVEAFYKNFCGDGTMNSKRAARALHRAVQSLANDKDMPLDQRILFMHIGI